MSATGQREHLEPRGSERVGIPAFRRQDDRAALAVEGALAGAHPIPQGRGPILRRRVFDEPEPELRLGIELILERARREGRQQTAGLQQDEARGDVEERRHFVRRQRGHRAHARQVLVREVAEPHREDIELPVFDQLEQ